MTDFFISEALRSAREGEKKGELPVGAVIVQGDRILAAAHNDTKHTASALAHAELCALSLAFQQYPSHLPAHSMLFVTLAPCLMCLGACANAEVRTIWYGSESEKEQSIIEYCALEKRIFLKKWQHRNEECCSLIQNFFEKKR